MPKGGARPGSGRKPGAASVKTAAARERLTADGLQPLDIMFAALRREEVILKDGSKTLVDEVMFAAAIAAAPYVHPRLSQIEAKVDTNVTQYVIAGIPESTSEDAWVTQHQNMH